MSQPSASLLRDIVTRFRPLSASDHALWSLRAFSGYSFAAGYDTVPIALAEVQPAAAALPLLFERDGPMMRPVVVLRPRLPDGRILPLIDDRGRLASPYTPGLLRMHPFALRPAPGGEGILCLDTDSPWLGRDLTQAGPGSQRLFDLNGAPGEVLTRARSFFDRFQPSYAAAATAATALQRAGLLGPAGEAAPQEGRLFRVDRAALDRLLLGGAGEDRGDIANLAGNGALELAFAQITSQHRVAHLQRVHISWQKEGGEETSARQAPAQAASVESFMEAMASSYGQARPDIFDDGER